MDVSYPQVSKIAVSFRSVDKLVGVVCVNRLTRANGDGLADDTHLLALDGVRVHFDPAYESVRPLLSNSLFCLG